MVMLNIFCSDTGVSFAAGRIGVCWQSMSEQAKGWHPALAGKTCLEEERKQKEDRKHLSKTLRVCGSMSGCL